MVVNGYDIKSQANLIEADLRCENLTSANLWGADLRCANLWGADLSYANLCDADLRGADLRFAVLTAADLSKAVLTCTCLDECELIRKGIKLNEKMIGYKKCKNKAIVKLEIPRGAIVFSINNCKCRTDKCKVLEITDRRGNKIDRAFSEYKHFSYYVGDVIEVFDFNCEYNVECGKGIHFFRTREEAEGYY